MPAITHDQQADDRNKSEKRFRLKGLLKGSQGFNVHEIRDYYTAEFHWIYHVKIGYQTH